jgi:CheY-like chemotaxis protein
LFTFALLIFLLSPAKLKSKNSKGTKMNKILVMSNDPVLKKKNVEALIDGGFEVAEVSDALDGLLMVDKNGFVAIVIDEELADIDGYRACQKIRQYSQIPLILLGTEQSDEIWANIDDLGFDIYLKKPVSPRELVAQIKSILRRVKPEKKETPVQLPKFTEAKSVPIANTQKAKTARMEETVGESMPVKAESPVELPNLIVAPIQETGSVKFGRYEQQNTAVEEEIIERKATPAAFLREAPYDSLADVGKEEKVVQIQRPVEFVASRVMPPLQKPKPAQPEKIAESENALKKAKSAEKYPTFMTDITETKSVRLDGQVEPRMKLEAERFTYKAWADARMAKLVDALASGKFMEIHPVLDFSASCGFAYPEVDRFIGVTGEETGVLLQRLAEEQVLNKTPYEKLHMDTDGGFQLVPVERCPHCASGNLARGQIIEQFSCGNLGVGQDYKADHKYICHKCGKELKPLGTDYRNIGIRYRCLNCNEIFPTTVIKWRSLSSGKDWSFEGLKEIQIYSYSLNPDKKDWLVFQLKPKAQLVSFLRTRGYQVEEMARIHGSSGAVHTIDILATRDDGLAKYHVGIGILIASHGKQEVGLEEVFEFDNKAYDVGINYKVAIVVPKLNLEAAKFADRQKIGIIETSDPSELITFLNTQSRSLADAMATKAPFLSQVSSTAGPIARIVSFLRQRGYDAFERVKIPGKSGAEHILDVFAQRDDVIVKPAIAIAVVSGEQGQQVVGIDKVSQFDSEAFDTGIRNKVLIGLSPVTQEARQFAMQQKIKILEEHDVENLIRSWAMA